MSPRFIASSQGALVDAAALCIMYSPWRASMKPSVSLVAMSRKSSIHPPPWNCAAVVVTLARPAAAFALHLLLRVGEFRHHHAVVKTEVAPLPHCAVCFCAWICRLLMPIDAES